MQSPESHAQEIRPNLEADPTLTLFARVNSAAIQEQIVRLAHEDELFPHSHYLPTHDNSGACSGERGVLKERDHAKTLEQIRTEVLQRIRQITQLDGEHNVVYLTPKHISRDERVTRGSGYEPAKYHNETWGQIGDVFIDRFDEGLAQNK